MSIKLIPTIPASNTPNRFKGARTNEVSITVSNSSFLSIPTDKKNIAWIKTDKNSFLITLGERKNGSRFTKLLHIPLNDFLETFVPKLQDLKNSFKIGFAPEHEDAVLKIIQKSNLPLSQIPEIIFPN